MKTRIHPAAIGMFIVGALVILLACLVLFGRGRFFRQTKDYVLTFPEPVTGLELDAPVKLMGVSIGNVKDISIELNADPTNALLVTVIIEVDIKASQAVFHNHSLDLNDRAKFERIVNEQGLRGRLEVLSLLSGQLYIALDMFPGMAGFQLDHEIGRLWQIPTLPSTKRRLIESAVTSLNNFTTFDFKGTSEELKGLLSDLRSEVAEMELGRVGTNLSATLVEARAVIGNPELKSAVTNLNLALAQIKLLGESLNSNIDPLFADARADLKKAGSMLDEAVQTLRQVKTFVQPDSALSRELVRTLDEAGLALNAVRQLADQLDRNPSSLITGRKQTNP